MNKVKVVADEFGSVIRVSQNNPDYGFVRVEQDAIEVSNGWVRRKVRSSIVPGLVADLKAIGWKANELLEGKVTVKESLEPIMESNPDFGVKRAGQDGPVCLFEDQAIYRRTYYTMDVNDTDTFIQHTNVDEIRESNAKRSSIVQVAKPAKAAKVSASNDEIEIPVTADVEDSTDVAFDF
jgi:hypothetical protein